MRFLPLFILFPFAAFTQNLLVNGGFEEENSCSEYKVECAPEGWIYTVPSFIYYFKDAQLSHSGDRFVALIAGHAKKPYYRTFVRSRLVCGLRKGNSYRLRFYIKSKHPVLDSIGIYFSSYDFLFEKRPYRKIDPSIYLADALVKPQARDTGWQQIVMDYQATGNETFITLGNFKKNDVTGTTGLDRENYFFILMDDISLTPLDDKEKLCVDWQQNTEEIYAQDERHEYLDRLIKISRNKPLENIKISPMIVQKIDTLVLPDILFETGRFSLSQTANTFLDSICKRLAFIAVDSMVVEGHTDSVGIKESNEQLGHDRAIAVVNYFRNKLFQTNFITRSWGSEKPVADNRTVLGRQRNRRVEIYLYIRE